MGSFSKHKPEKIKLAGFNNLTKCLSFNLYDFQICSSEAQKEEYLRYIDGAYSSEKISEIARGICEIIEADVLDISNADYDPHGASTLVLMSDLKSGGDSNLPKVSKPELETRGSAVHAHLNKSHICAHTYPDTFSPDGVCSFRVDIDIATCGEITPMRALNYMFGSFESDVVIVDYVVRGFTRDTKGRKVYNDQHFDSIRDFVSKDILDQYQKLEDLNIPPAHIWQTKMLRLDLELQEYFMDPAELKTDEGLAKIELLRKEMKEIYYMHQV